MRRLIYEPFQPVCFKRDLAYTLTLTRFFTGPFYHALLLKCTHSFPCNTVHKDVSGRDATYVYVYDSGVLQLLRMCAVELVEKVRVERNVDELYALHTMKI